MKKKLLGLLLILISSILLNSGIILAGNQIPEIILAEGASDIPPEIIQQIIQKNPNSSVINISEYGKISELSLQNNFVVTEEPKSTDTPIFYNTGYSETYGTPTTKKTFTKRKVLAKTQFMLSVARGQKVTLNSTITASYSGNITGDFFDYFQLALGKVVTKSFTVGSTYTGPPENSGYNSRSFYVDFFQDEGSYVQTRQVYTSYLGTLINTRTETATGNFKEATEYASYDVMNNY